VSFNPSQARGSDGKWSSGIIDSIEHQMRAKGKTPEEAHALAIEIGQTHGFLDAKGNLTALGRKREALGHKGRMVDRAARALGRKPSEIGIQNNRAYVK
jgi:hypothetical protein